MVKKQIYYIYNPETDNFERVFPSFKRRVVRIAFFLSTSLFFGFGIYLLIFFMFDSPTEKSLREENSALRAQYSILNRRLDNSLKVMADIQNRDDNLYRAMVQMDPLTRGQRYAGLDNEKRYRELQTMTDGGLVSLLTRRLDLFERQLYAQSLSFDELRSNIDKQQDKLAHIPSVLPVDRKGMSISSGYGVRRDLVLGTSKFHSGFDFSGRIGEPVYATADGKIVRSGRDGERGTSIEIDHGFNYKTMYSHLSESEVRQGQEVKRGDLIGRIGNSGRSIGSHLHYEVLFKGEPQNPVNFFFMDISPTQYSEIVQQSENAGNMLD